MTDREYLLLAAKAAGIEFAWNDGQCGYPAVAGTLFDGVQWLISWNPLADDGDALRLAVKLCMGRDRLQGCDD
jgi:hypothetical protein